MSRLTKSVNKKKRIQKIWRRMRKAKKKTQTRQMKKRTNLSAKIMDFK